MKYVVDGTNILRSLSGESSLNILLTLLVEILKNGDDFYCIFDANTVYKLGNDEDKSIFKEVIRSYKDHFQVVTGGTQADLPILIYADINNINIISNDRYKSYIDRFPWLNERFTDRLIKVNLVGGVHFVIESLNYKPFDILKNSQDLILEFDQLVDPQTEQTNSSIDNFDTNSNSDFFEEIYDEVDKALRQIVEDHDKKLLDLKNYYRDELRKLSGMNSKLEDRLSSMEQKNTSLESKIFKLENIVKNGFKEIEKEGFGHSESKKESATKNNTYNTGENERAMGYASLYGIARKISNNLQKSGVTEKQRIKKVQKEINDFMCAYDGYEDEIPFRGFSWAAAVNGLKAFFQREKLCTNCYKVNSGYDGRCLYCKKNTLSNHPKDIWGIVERNSP